MTYTKKELLLSGTLSVILDEILQQYKVSKLTDSILKDVMEGFIPLLKNTEATYNAYKEVILANYREVLGDLHE